MNDSAAVPDPARGNYARFLRRLDPDPIRADELYNELRRLLISFFRWNRSSHPQDLADETIDRIAAKAVDEIENMNAYARKVAKFVLLEDVKKCGRETTIEEVATAESRPNGPEQEMIFSIDGDDRVECLRHCLATLAPNERTLAVEYYTTEGEKLKVHRQKLAVTGCITMNTLRVRANRVRKKLEECVTKCLQGRQKPSIQAG
jgi:DNA-directed RNA polymerase specialized sigma24 family protein